MSKVFYFFSNSVVFYCRVADRGLTGRWGGVYDELMDKHSDSSYFSKFHENVITRPNRFDLRKQIFL